MFCCVLRTLLNCSSPVKDTLVVNEFAVDIHSTNSSATFVQHSNSYKFFKRLHSYIR